MGRLGFSSWITARYYSYNNSGELTDMYRLLSNACTRPPVPFVIVVLWSIPTTVADSFMKHRDIPRYRGLSGDDTVC